MHPLFAVHVVSHHGNLMHEMSNMCSETDTHKYGDHDSN